MSVLVYPRSSWTATSPGFPRYSGRKLTPSRVTHLRLHYPGDGSHTRAHYTKAQSEQALRNYRGYHINTRRWADIGYPLAVDQSGRAWVAAGTTHAAAHSATPVRPNENWHSLAILLLIGNDERPSTAMINTVNAIWAGLIDGSLGLGTFSNMRTVTAHRDVPGATTRCAGPQVTSLLRQGAFRPTGQATTPTPSQEDDLSLQELIDFRPFPGDRNIFDYIMHLHNVILFDTRVNGRNLFDNDIHTHTLLNRANASIGSVADKVGAPVDVESLAASLAEALSGERAEIDEEAVKRAVRSVFADAAGVTEGD